MQLRVTVSFLPYRREGGRGRGGRKRRRGQHSLTTASEEKCELNNERLDKNAPTVQNIPQ